MTIYTDGAARGNPGPAGAGVFISPKGKFKKFLGETTNNVAEYSAVLFALEKAKELKAKEAGTPALLSKKLLINIFRGRKTKKRTN